MRYALLILLGVSSVCAIDQNKIRFVHLVYRHGDRAPSGNYPTDTHGAEAWPAGWQELTTLGMAQQYALGKYLRNRYDGFLNRNYNKTEIYVRSTDKDRTLQSAQSNLAGLYEPGSEQIWNPNILWQPIPVHTVPVAEDMLIANYVGEDKACPPYEQAVANQTYANIMNEKYKDFFNNLTSWTNMTVNWATFDDITGPVTREMANNLSQPYWVYITWPQYENRATYEILTDLSDEQKMLDYNTPLKGKLSGGLLLADIVMRMGNVSVGSYKPKTLKVQMYSAHAETVLALMSAMNILNGRTPPYTACLMIELYERQNGSFTVETYYFNQTGTDWTRMGDPLPMPIQGCQNPTACTLDEFSNAAFKDTILYDRKEWFYACQRRTPLEEACSKKGQSTARFSVLTGIAAAIALLMHRP